ncbi:hypothetical protein NDU88_001397 [Pleurodeles waltl]|uniref:Uncharacterized protein n=1 Tax=Pleurodeles waltl TaxID=8319 RepID=A0AAV7SZ38_PLEWA|nr:hypothetical protein NDU88_001397 [Pleurodeles waltl]
MEAVCLKLSSLYDVRQELAVSPDPAAKDRLRHPLGSFYLGEDEGKIRYPGQPFTCRKFQAVGHKGIDCPEKFCRICRQTGHEASGYTGKKACNFCGGEGHTYYWCPKSEKPKACAAAAAGTPTPKTTRPKLDPTANAKVNTRLKASREEAQQKPEPTRSSTREGPALQDQEPPGPGPERIQATTVSTVEPTTVVDPATPPEAAVTVEPPHPEGTLEEGAPKDARHKKPKGSRKLCQQLGPRMERRPRLQSRQKGRRRGNSPRRKRTAAETRRRLKRCGTK